MEEFIITKELLDEFKKSVSPYLTDIDKIVYQNKVESHIAKTNGSCSILEIFISRESEYKKLNLDPIRGNWDDIFPYTKEIKHVWNTLLKKYKTLDENDTKIGYVFFHCSESIVKHKIAYQSKGKIKIELEKQLPKIKYLFCSSELEYTIILKNESAYKQYNFFTIEKIKAIILNILKAECKNEGCIYNFSIDDFRCQLLHLKMMKGLSLYGLSRED